MEIKIEIAEEDAKPLASASESWGRWSECCQPHLPIRKLRIKDQKGFPKVIQGARADLVWNQGLSNNSSLIPASSRHFPAPVPCSAMVLLI